MNVGKEVVILHDTDGKPYFEAIEYLKNNNKISSLIYLESSVIFLLMRAILKRNINFKILSHLFDNLVFRLKLPFIKDKIIVMGMGPYDFRFLIYSLLAYRNKLIYQTSWPYWWSDNVPKRYWLFTSIAKKTIKYCLENRPITVLCVSNSAYETLCSGLTSVAKNKVFLLPHCVNSSVFKPGCKWPDKSKDGSKPIGGFNILFVGRLVSSKGIPLIIDLINAADPALFNFTIVGGGTLLNLLKNKYNNVDNVRICGPIKNKSDLSKIYASADVLLVPSVRTKRWEELFGIVIVEGLSCGAIVLASDHVGPKEIIDHGVTGFLFSDQVSASDYLNVITELCSDMEMYRRISNNAIESAKKYSIEAIASRWFEFLRG